MEEKYTLFIGFNLDENQEESYKKIKQFLSDKLFGNMIRFYPWGESLEIGDIEIEGEEFKKWIFIGIKSINRKALNAIQLEILMYAYLNEIDMYKPEIYPE